MNSRLLLFLSLGILAVSYLLYQASTDQGHLLDAQIAPRSSEMLEVLRDESGAVVLSDPNDDLAGYVRTRSPDFTRNAPVDERELHLLELYGIQPRRQLVVERSMLLERFQIELAEAFEDSFDSGNYRVLSSDKRPSTSPTALSEVRLAPIESPGTNERRLATLERVDHPGLYNLRDTLAWLDNRLGD
jgi:hypothetical protein